MIDSKLQVKEGSRKAVSKLSDFTPVQLDGTIKALIEFAKSTPVTKSAAAVFKANKTQIKKAFDTLNEKVDHFLYKSCGSEQGCAEIYDKETDTTLILVEKHSKVYDDDDVLEQLYKERDAIAEKISERKKELEKQDRVTYQAQRPYYQVKK